MAKKDNIDDLNAQIQILTDKNIAVEKEIEEAAKHIADLQLEIEELKTAPAAKGPAVTSNENEAAPGELTSLEDLLKGFYHEGQNIRKDFPKNKILRGCYVYIDNQQRFINIFCTSIGGKEFLLSKEKFSHEALDNTVKSLAE